VPDRPAKGRVAQRTQKPKWEERLGRRCRTNTIKPRTLTLRATDWFEIGCSQVREA